MIYKFFRVVLLLLLFSLASCEQPLKPKEALTRIIQDLETPSTIYFSFDYQRIHGEKTETLSGISSLKRKGASYVNSAYFSMNDSSDMNYLSIISDSHTSVERLISKVLEESAIIHLRDSICSPVLLKPSWLKNLSDKSKEIAIINHTESDKINMAIRTDDVLLDVHFDNKLSMITSLSITELSDQADQVKHHWQFSPLLKSGFQELVAKSEEVLKKQQYQTL